MMLFSGAVISIYLIALGIMLSVMANESDEPAFCLLILPYLLVFDFLSRFALQQTPAMQAKPYFLLPIERRSVIDFFLVNTVLSGANLFWLSFFIPYLIITVAGGASWLTAILVLINGMILVLINSQWYLLIRTLVARTVLWWILPAIVYTFYILPLIYVEDVPAIESVLDFVAENGGAWWATILCLLVLAGFYALNRNMQFRFVFEEVSKEEKSAAPVKHVSTFAFLDKFGLTGEYLKLELKSIMRNKAIRSRCYMSLVLVVVLSAIITFTEIYDSFMLLNFWCYYCFSIYGMTTLVKIMGPEGNYIDLLITQRKNIFLLLEAKYCFHCIILVVPFLIMLPAVFNGKFSMLMMFAYLFMSSGVLYFTLFQLAVFNKQTLPLDTKVTGKNNMENGLQIIFELVGMTLPVLLISVFLILFSEATAYIILIGIGLLFTLLHPLWLHDVYRRMMKRRYENLEGFHATR